MLLGILFALGACFFWGLIFVVPEVMKGFSVIEVVLGRHFFYGIISLIIFAKNNFKKPLQYPLRVWKKAFFLSFIMNMLLYSCIVLSSRYATPAVCALFMGLSPIAITIWGNFTKKEINYSSLALPFLLIFAGLVMVNFPHFQDTAKGFELSYIGGLFAAIFALIFWTLFVVGNARFLKETPEVSSEEWSTVLGLTTLFWVFLVASVLVLFVADSAEINKYFVFSESLKVYLIGSLILGFFSSWLAALLWNKASYYLPVTMTGQLTIFETIFGVLFVWIFQQRMPPPLEAYGFVLMLGAIIWAIKAVSKQLSIKERASYDPA